LGYRKVERNSFNSYEVTATETITELQSIPNYNDDGSPAPNATERLEAERVGKLLDRSAHPRMEE
jgi:hypothetical protein